MEKSRAGVSVVYVFKKVKIVAVTVLSPTRETNDELFHNMEGTPSMEY